MDKPTDAQIKEVWELCGLEYTAPYWIDKAGNVAFYGEVYSELLKSINPTNLFLYAVPVAIDKIMAQRKCSSDVAYAILFKKWLQKLELDIPNHEGTLFWTIWEVIHDKS